MPDQKGLLNYTTSIPADRTLQEMQAALGRAGARRVMVEYENGAAAALAFSLRTTHGERLYTLPCDIDAVHRILQSQVKNGVIKSGGGSLASKSSREQAERVAWRVLKDWLEVQLALVQTQMAALDQVMLPYLHVDADTTLYQAWREDEVRALPAGPTS